MSNEPILLLHGLPRGNEKVWGNLIKHLIMPNKINKIFIHSWSNISSNKNHHGNSEPDSKDLEKYINFFKKNFELTYKIGFQKLHKPEFVQTPWGLINHSNRQNSILSQLEVLRIAEKKCNNTPLILSRSDIFFKNDLFIGDLLEKGSWCHFGYWDKNNQRFECEDLIMIFSENPKNDFEKIASDNKKMHLYEKGIYNSQVEIVSLKLYSLKIDFKFNRDYKIFRKQNLLVFLKNTYYSIRKQLGILKNKFYETFKLP